ncbi:hypothetical protein OEZ85_004508 [Tetradesmus obliquus]|uniref:Uncharacterized protein n=1 Tax=Tetradesmus obliquus TaxID=3088 RepID=A0ABY8UMD8_TETOB|nr:hypothetical protein OEZ85_004508 [Tetradesmus obliquus]
MPSQRRNPSRAAPTYQPYNGPPPPRSIKSLSQERFHLLKRLEQVAEEVGCSFILLHSVRAAYKFYHDMGYLRRTAAALYRLDKCVLKMADLEKGENISWTKPEASMTWVPWIFRNYVEGSDEDFLFREEVEAAMRSKLSTVKKNWSSKDDGELKQKLLKHNKELIKDAIDSLWGTLLINGFYMAKLVKPKWVDSLKKWAQQEHQWAYAEDTKTWKEVY